MVIAAASTGKEINKRKLTVSWAIINKECLKKENWSDKGRIKIVTIKFIDDNIELAPARCREKIIKSVEREEDPG